MDVEPGRDPLVAGSQAAALLDAFHARPNQALKAAVVGPGGSGKSALLAALEGAARTRGVATRRLGAAGEVPAVDADDPGTLLLVDDAHGLAPEVLHRLTVLADRPATRLVVAARPAPRPAPLAPLSLALSRARPPVTLAALDVDGTRERLAAVIGHCARPLAARVVALSGGLPALVDRLAVAVRDHGPSVLVEGDGPGGDGLAGATELLRVALEALDPPVRRLLIALAVSGAGTVAGADTPRRAALGDLLGVDLPDVDDLVARAVASGLLRPAEGANGVDDADGVGSGDVGTLAPLVCRAVERHSDSVERFGLCRALAEQALARGGSVLAPARSLSGSGVQGVSLREVFIAAGDEALSVRPDVAGRFYTDAVVAGLPAREVVVRRATAAALDADLDTALRLADPVTVDPAAPDRSGAVAVVASVMARRGMAVEAATMLARGAADGLPGLAALAVPGLVMTGSPHRAREAFGAAAADAAAECSRSVPAPLSGASSVLRSVHALVAEGMLEATGPASGTALSRLTRAASLLEPLGSAVLLPESPASLAAAVALHRGELDVADSVLRRALDAGVGGPASTTRHRLLRAFVAMIRGDPGVARALVDGAERLEPGDELVAAAIEIGLARRSGDVAALRLVWARAREACVRQPVDLGGLACFGEIVVGAARLGELAAMRDAAAQIEDLLARLDDPPAWRSLPSWYLHEAATTVGDDTAAERHVRVLGVLGPQGSLAAALSDAARVRSALAAARVDAVEVEAAAVALHRVGWSWDGARLAADAAARTGERRAAAGLLACARSLCDVGDPVAPADESPLSEREREVAALVLAGLTYKQIGERLYISAKTVEHHVARMRKRLDSASRGELFARLRDLVGDRVPAGISAAGVSGHG